MSTAQKIIYHLKNFKNLKLRPNSGFTLIELMVTISIIAVMASIGLVVYSQTQKAARISKRIQDLEALRTALELQKTTAGTYPTQGSIGCIPASIATNGSVDYMQSLPRDPLEDDTGANCYQYIGNSNEYKIRTNPALYPDEMTTIDLNRQSAMIDPATSGSCTGTKCWAIWNGSNAKTW